MPVTIPDSYLFPYQPLDVAAYLRAAHSPRADDLRDFASWVDQAARQYDICGRWLLMLAEKEQSFLTRRNDGSPGWERAYKWALGFGATDGGDLPAQGLAGPKNQVFRAAKGLRRYLTPGDSLCVLGMVGHEQSGTQGRFTPRTVAEAAAWQYTPWVRYLQDILDVWAALERRAPEQWKGPDTMASGYASTHPSTEALLREVGVTDGQVTQGWGSARASAGYHDPEGYMGVRRFSSCTDLSAALASVPTGHDLFNRLLQAAVCPFLRRSDTGWNGSSHIHCVSVGLRDGRGNVTILPGPRSQILDFVRGKNGLVGHAALKGPWVPTSAQKEDIRKHYDAWAPDLATGVWRGDERIPCYAWYEWGKVRADVRRLGEGLGGRVTWDGSGAHLFDDHGAEVVLTTGKVEVDYYRADVREIAEAFGYEVAFRTLNDGAACRVDLSR